MAVGVAVDCEEVRRGEEAIGVPARAACVCIALKACSRAGDGGAGRVDGWRVRGEGVVLHLHRVAARGACAHRGDRDALRQGRHDLAGRAHG